MEISKINESLSLIANVGVLIGIIILVIEINQNTRATEAQVTWEHNNAVRELYYPAVMDPVFRPIMLKLRGLSEDQLGELVQNNDPEFRSYSLWFSIQMNMWEARFYTQTTDLERQRLRNVVLTQSSFAELEIFVALNMTLNRFRPEFRSFYEGIQQELRNL